MGFAERLSSACVTSDLKSVEEKIKPVEHVVALSGATSIGSDMFRARDHDISALRRAILLLARKARNELHIGMEPSQQLATAAIMEIMHWQCRTCNGASEQRIDGLRKICPTCGGTGVHWWSDKERAKASMYPLDTWVKWSPKYEKILAMARRADSSTIHASRQKMG